MLHFKPTRVKRTSKTGPTKIWLSFQLTRKIDSAKDDSDTNTDIQRQSKIHFNDDVRKYYEYVKDFYAYIIVRLCNIFDVSFLTS